MADESVSEQRIRKVILELLQQRGIGKTICPSEAARALQPKDWRPLMPSIRDVATLLADEGSVEVCQRGEVIDLRESRGPIRLRLSNREQGAT